MKIKWNEAELRKLQQGIAEKIKRADRQARSKAAGKSASEALPIVKRELAAIGVQLPDDKLREYAEHVASGKDFKFVLK